MLKIFICAQILAAFCPWFLQRATLPGMQKEPAVRAYIFLGTDCPISQDYIGVLNDMAQEYEGRVSFVGIVPQPHSVREVDAFRREYEVNFGLQADAKMAMVNKYQAQTTPEAVLLDGDGIIQYRGAIDNWYYALGKHRAAATEYYLRDAIEALLMGRPIKMNSTEAVGCPINMPAQRHH